MEQQRSRAVVAVVILLAVGSPRRVTSAASDCPSPQAVPTPSSVVDTATAKQSERRHLEALFDR